MGYIGVKAKHKSFASWRREKSWIDHRESVFFLIREVVSFALSSTTKHIFKGLDEATSDGPITQGSFCVLQNQTQLEEVKINQTYTYIYIYDLWQNTLALITAQDWKLVQVEENTRIVSKSALIAGIDFLNFWSISLLLFLMSAESHFFLL